MTQRVLLCIMDGWGISCENDKTNAVKLANPVNFYKLKETKQQAGDSLLVVFALSLITHFIIAFLS